MQCVNSNHKHRRLRKPWRITLKTLALIATAGLPASAGAVPHVTYAEPTEIQSNIAINQDRESLVLPGITTKETGKVGYITKEIPILISAKPPAASLRQAGKREKVIVLDNTGEYAKVVTREGKVGYIPGTDLSDTLDSIWDDTSLTRYAGADGVSVLDRPGGAVIGELPGYSEIEITGQNDSGYYRVSYNGAAGYVSCDSTVDSLPAPEPTSEPESAISTPESSLSGTSGSTWNGAVLSRSAGAVQGPSGKETYYNLNMSGVVSLMSAYGYSASDYWVRDDGVKMLGQYVMCAANLNLRPRGTLVESSVGTAIVCDTGGFAANNPTQLDIATSW